MRLRLRQGLWTAALLISPFLLLVSCGKPKVAPVVPAPPEAAVAPSGNRARLIPHRTVPLLVTNRIEVDAAAPVQTNSPPSVTCGPVQAFPCSSVDGVEAVVAIHVEDPDGDPLSVVWTIDGRDRNTQQVAAAGPPTAADLTYSYTYTPGEHLVKVSVNDGKLSAECSTTVNVQRDAQEPVIVCPSDLTVMTDPGQCTAVVNFNARATDNCPGVTVAYDPPSGTAFPIGVSTVTCTATDTAGNKSSCTFQVVVQITNRCPQSEAFWRQNPGAWPVNSLVLGGQVYTKSQLMALLHAVAPSDASIALAHQLIAAGLNTALGADPRPICGQLNEANALLAGFPGKLPFHVNLATPPARPMLNLSTVLNSYNGGMLTIPNCVP